MDWASHGSCKKADQQTHNWFPEFGEFKTKEAIRAKRVCQTCPVREACLTYSFENEIFHGTWGGLDEMERRAYAKRHALRSRSPVR